MCVPKLGSPVKSLIITIIQEGLNYGARLGGAINRVEVLVVVR